VWNTQSVLTGSATGSARAERARDGGRRRVARPAASRRADQLQGKQPQRHRPPRIGRGQAATRAGGKRPRQG
jgi:hypothetical protein